MKRRESNGLRASPDLRGAGGSGRCGFPAFDVRGRAHTESIGARGAARRWRPRTGPSRSNALAALDSTLCGRSAAAVHARSDACHLGARERQRLVAHRVIELLIGRLITDEQFRDEFLRDREATLRRLCEQGFELSHTERAAVLHTDADLWVRTASAIDPRLQKIWFENEVTIRPAAPSAK